MRPGQGEGEGSPPRGGKERRENSAEKEYQITRERNMSEYSGEGEENGDGVGDLSPCHVTAQRGVGGSEEPRMRSLDIRRRGEPGVTEGGQGVDERARREDMSDVESETACVGAEGAPTSTPYEQSGEGEESGEGAEGKSAEQSGKSEGPIT